MPRGADVAPRLHYSSFKQISGVIFPVIRSVKMRFLMIRAVGLLSYFNVVFRVIFCNEYVRMHLVQHPTHYAVTVWAMYSWNKQANTPQSFVLR